MFRGGLSRRPGLPPGWVGWRGHRCLRGGRLRRELAAMEAALTAQTPGLASLYETFNRLNRGERPLAGPPGGAEPLPVPVWRRPRFAGIATLAALALLVALCVTLSAQFRPAVQSCLAAAAAPAAAAAAASAPVRALACREYPVGK
jgi:hypothetical protein